VLSLQRAQERRDATQGEGGAEGSQGVHRVMHVQRLAVHLVGIVQLGGRWCKCIPRIIFKIIIQSKLHASRRCAVVIEQVARELEVQKAFADRRGLPIEEIPHSPVLCSFQGQLSGRPRGALSCTGKSVRQMDTNRITASGLYPWWHTATWRHARYQSNPPIASRRYAAPSRAQNGGRKHPEGLRRAHSQ